MAKRPTPQGEARAIIAPQYKPLKAGYAAATARSNRESAAAQAARIAIVKQLQAGVAPAGATYDAAAAQQQTLAQQGAAALAHANPEAQVQSELAAVNAPPEQRAQLAAQMGHEFGGQGAVLDVLQGTVPGASLEAQKAATQQFMAGLPTVASLAGEQTLRGLAEARRQAAEQYAQQRLQVGAQLPGLATDIANRRQDVAFQERQFQAQQAEAIAQRQFQARQAQLDRIAQSATTPYQQAQLKLAYDQLAADKQAAQQKTVVSPLDVYKAQTDRINAQRERRQATAAAKGGTSGMTQTQTRAATAKGNQLIAHVRQARAYAKEGKTVPSGPNAGQPITAPTYNEAVQQAEQQGIPLEIAVRMLNRVYPAQYEVTDHGLVQIGIRGQPSTFTKQPRRKKRRK